MGLALTKGLGIGEGVGVTVADGVRKGVVLGGMVGVKIGGGVGEGIEVGVGVGSGSSGSSQPNRNNPTRGRENVRKQLIRFRPILRFLDIYDALSIRMPGPRGRYRRVFPPKGTWVHRGSAAAASFCTRESYKNSQGKTSVIQVLPAC